MEEKVSPDIMQFVVFAIECAARKSGIPSPVLFNRLQRLDMVQRVLVDGYDMLHTQGKSYIADYVIDALHNWESLNEVKGGQA